MPTGIYLIGRPGRRPGWLLPLLAGTLALLVFGAAFLATGGGHPTPTTTLAAPGEVAPLDLAGVADPVAAHYRFAHAHAAAFRLIPCYCGCQQSLGHHNLADCYLRRDGRGWEAHAAGCGVCQGEAASAARLLRRGMSPAVVAAAVIRQFGATIATTQPASP